MRLAKLFFASILFIFGSLFFVSTASAQGSGETSFLSNFDFSMYGDSTGRVGSYSYYAPAGFSTALPSLDLARSKFGPGSLLFRSDGKYHSILQYFSAGQEISLVGGEFTIDFWVYPTEYDINSSYSFFRFCSDASCKKYLLFWKSFGHADYNNPDYTASDKRFSFKYYDEDTLLTVPAGGEVAPGQYASRFYVIPKKGVDLVPNQWNHIALQRKNQDGQAYVNLAINGQASPWKKFYVNSAITLPSFRGIDLGDIYYYPGAPMFRGSIDDFRVIKDRAIWRDVPDNGTFTEPVRADYGEYIEPENSMAAPTSGGTPMVTGIAPLLLVHFDVNYYDDTINAIRSTYFVGGEPPIIDSIIKKFGSASAHFPAAGTDRKNVYIDPRLDLAGGDFTIDFWWYPTGDLTTFNKALLSFFSTNASGGTEDWKWYLNYDGRGTTPGFSVIDGQGKLLRWMGSGSLLRVNEWNHISLQKKQGTGGNDGGSGLGISINGYMRPSNSFYNYGTLPTGSGALVLGDNSTTFPRVDYHLDELRVTKGTALWGNAANQNGYFARPTKGDYSNLIVDQNKIATPVAEGIGGHSVSLGNIPDSSQSSVAYPTCPPGSSRPSVREEYLIKLDGTPKLTSYFDANSKLICTSYWAGNATTSDSKKIKRFEYDADGQIAREIYYGIDGASITDVVTYQPKSVGGARQKEVQNRNGTEYYKRYSTTGRLLYEHEYKNGYVVSRNFTYDGAGRLASELVFHSPSKYEKVVYTRNGSGVVTQTDSYRAYAPIGTDTANYVHTTSTYAGTVVTGITRTYFNKDAGSPTALRTEITEYNTTSGVVIKQRTFDYAQNKQKYSTYITTTGSKSLGKLKTDEEWSLTDNTYASSSLAYDTTTGDLISWKKTDYAEMGDPGVNLSYYSTKYAVYNPKTGLVQNEDAYTYWPSLNLKQTDSVDYDDKGIVVTRYVHESRDSSSVVYSHTSNKYSPEGLIKSVSKYDEITGNAIRAEWYYGNGEVWYKSDYIASSNQYSISSYYVNYINNLSTSTPGDLVADGVSVKTKDFKFVSQTTPREPRAQQMLGEKIIAGISDSSLRSQAQTGAEKVAILAVLKAFLPAYKTALNNATDIDPVKQKAKRYEVYVAYSWKIVRAIYAIEYRFHNGSPKFLNTDSALDTTVTSWYGIDGDDPSGNTEFWGLYIRPGAVSHADSDAVYVDMDILNPSSVDVAVNATSYDTIKSFRKKIEKWDALRTGQGFSYFNNTFSLFNLSGGVGRFITLDEITKADPTVKLTLNRFEEDMKVAGVNLASLSETTLIEKMYEYFNKQSYFSYLYDLSQVSQTVNQTLVRKGGDCEDFGLFFLSLLREEFDRLGNTDAINRLGLVTANVDENNPITEQNVGGGHATVGFRQGSTYYYIEASYLFLGAGADATKPTPRVLNPLDGSGVTKTLLNVATQQVGWHVKVADFFYILPQAKVTFNVRNFYDTISQTNTVDTAVARVSNINTYLEPYDPIVTTLASSTVQTIPNFKNQSVDFVVESTHNFFGRLAQYVPDTGADVWKKVIETIPPVINPDGTVNLSAKISGDCEDLAFAEASLLENVLLRYYLAGGAVPENAVNQAKKNVIVVAEKDYGGVAGRSHLYVGYLTPKTDTSPAVVRLIDPQSGTIGAPQLMTDLYNDKYLFFADREKVSAITPYDWSLLSLSAATKAAAADGVVLNPSPVEPKAPVAQNLTPTQQTAVINAAVAADPPKPSAVKQFLNFVYDKSGLKAIVQSNTILEAVVRVAVKAALLIGGGPIGTAVQLAASAINAAIVGNFVDKGPIPTAEEAGVRVVNGVATVVGALTKPGGADTPERADAEAALRAGRTVPATPANMDSNNSSATEAAATTRQSGQVIVQRNSNTSVVNAIGPNETSRTTTTKVYNPATNVMVITTNTTIVIPQSPMTFFRPPVQSCPTGTPVCTGSEGVTIPAFARADGAQSSCYSEPAPSCGTRQYDTAWVCEPFYDKNVAGTGCTCVDPLATSVSPIGECQYGATISCVNEGGIAPPANSVRGSESYSAPAGQTSSSTIPWSYNASAVAGSTGCIWSCASGFVKNGVECVLDQVFTCSDVPSSFLGRASMCPINSPGLNSTSNLNSTLVASCGNVPGTPQRCEYSCTNGYDKVGGTCQCVSPKRDDLRPGFCTDVTMETSQVTLSAARAITPGNYETPTTLQQTITVKKGQAFKLSWAQSNSSITGECESTTGTGLFSGSPLNQATQVNWTRSSLDLAGNIEDLKLDKAGSYIFSASCRYGTGASQQNSLPSTVRVTVDPSGVFEEF